jgi:hypothetical protein
MRSWVITYVELTQLYAQLNVALSNPADQLVTSAHCHQCPSLVPCPAARMAEMNAIDATSTVFEDTTSNADLSFTLDNLNRASKMIEDRLKAFEELAKHRVTAGQVVDNYSVEMGLGNRRFKEGMTADILKAMTGKDLSQQKLVTPAAAERMGVDEIIINALTERPTTGVKLVRVKASKKAERIFSGTKGR